MLTLLTGTDTYRIAQARTAKVAACSTAPLRIDLGTSGALRELADACRASSLFGDAQAILLTGTLTADLAETLKEQGAATRADVHCIAVFPSLGMLAAQKKLLARIQALATTVESYDPLTGAAQNAWASELVTARGGRIDPPALRELLARTGGDSWAIAHEIEKLCAWAGEEPITLAAVTTLVPASAERDQWALSNAIGSGNKRAGVVALWRALQAGEESFALIGMLAASFRTLTLTSDLARRNTPSARIATLCGLHPFVVSKTLTHARATEPATAAQALSSLAHLEQRAKQGLRDSVDGLYDILLAQ